MLMVIDAGNTTIQGGIYQDEKLILQFRKPTIKGTSSDELGIFLKTVLRENSIDYTKITKIGCCSVVPSINHSLSNACIKYFNKEALFIQAGIKTGLKLKYSNPKEIGADRIAGAIAATKLFPEQNLIIIDMGTATTIDIVTKEKEYLGGVILPGLKISEEALAQGTAKLPSVEIIKPEKCFGSSTIEAIQAGIYYGNIGAIKEFCYLFEKNVFKGQNAFVIGAGGFSKLYESSNIFNKIIPELVLYGVKTALEINQ